MVTGLIWTEKYRPSKFEEVIGQDDIVKAVKAMVEKRNLPHLMFAGTPGTGKTTLAMVIAKQLFKEHWRQNFLELNASDDRGIDVVRNTIKDFARTKAIGDFQFKIILLDECDSLTREAQQALRRTMENFVNTTRFILSCNYASKIVDAIQSRCAVFKFKPLTSAQFNKIVLDIAEKERLHVNDEAMKALHEVCEGDVRRLINIMQSCAAVSSKIDSCNVYDMASFAQPQELKTVLQLAADGRFETARNKLFDIMLKHGLSGIDVVKQVQKEAWQLNIDNKKKLKIVEKCGEIEFRIVEGSNEFIQLEALLASFGY